MVFNFTQIVALDHRQSTLETRYEQARTKTEQYLTPILGLFDKTLIATPRQYLHHAVPIPIPIHEHIFTLNTPTQSNHTAPSSSPKSQTQLENDSPHRSTPPQQIIQQLPQRL